MIYLLAKIVSALGCIASEIHPLRVITDYAAENFVHVLWKYISSSGSSIYQNYTHPQLEYKKDDKTLAERIDQIDQLEKKEFQRIDQFEKLRQDLLRELKSKKVSK